MKTIKNNRAEFLDLYKGFINSIEWTKCDTKIVEENIEYYDYEDNLEKLIKKIRKLKEITTDSKWYTICFFKDSKLFRIILKSIVFSYDLFFTYNINGKIESVYKFQIKMTDKIGTSFVDLSDVWEYTYDEGSRIKELLLNICNCGYNPNWLKSIPILLCYIYDEKGLAKIYKNISLTDDSSTEIDYYDRELSRKLSKCTVSRTPYTINHKKGVKIFSRQFYENFDVPICPICYKETTYFGFVDLDPDIFKSKLKSGKIPVFTCLDCLESITYPLKQESYEDFEPVSEIQIFPDEGYLFKKCRDEEKAEESLIKIGGLPDWIQDDDHPDCPECQEPMIFITQIKSNEDLQAGDKIQMFGDSGTLYVFAHCGTILTMMQYY